MVLKTRKRFHLNDKLEAVERVINGEESGAVATSMGTEKELVDKWHGLFFSTGRRALCYTREPGEVPTLGTLQIDRQKAFPTRLLHGCESAAAFFCAFFYGKNDVIHLYNLGVPDVALVDIDEEKLEVMRDVYPDAWETCVEDATAAARRFASESRSFDIVVCDTYTPMANDISFDRFHVFTEICRKYCLMMYNAPMFASLGIEPEPPELARVLKGRTRARVEVVDIIKRSTHNGGIYWCVFRPAVG